MAPARTLLTMSEICAWLGVSDQTVRRAMSAGLPSRLLGSRRRFTVEDVEGWWKLNEPLRPMPKRVSADSSELPPGLLRSTGLSASK
jgi:excisionase family DNA binding protein